MVRETGGGQASDNPANTRRSFPKAQDDGHRHQYKLKSSPYTGATALFHDCTNCTNKFNTSWWECTECGRRVCLWCKQHSSKDLGDFIDEKADGRGPYYIDRKYQ